jgi:hypothetical protein
MKTKKVVVHTLTICTVNRPNLFVTDPLYEWQISDQGRWVLEHAVELPVTKIIMEPHIWVYTYKVIAKLREIDITEFYLRWG